MQEFEELRDNLELQQRYENLQTKVRPIFGLWNAAIYGPLAMLQILQQDAWKVSIYSLCCPSILMVAHHSSAVQLNLIQENFR